MNRHSRQTDQNRTEDYKSSRRMRMEAEAMVYFWCKVVIYTVKYKQRCAANKVLLLDDDAHHGRILL